MKRFAGFFDVLKGAFRARFQPATLTANRDVTLADKSGTMVVMEAAAATNANIPLNGITTYPTWTVAGAITFAAASGAVAGGVAYVRLVANGVNVPSMGPFKRRTDSRNYINTNGTTNVFEFSFDGVDYWYTVWAENSSTITTDGIMRRTEVDSVISASSILWSQITSRPTTVAGFGITDGVTTGTDQSITGKKTFTGNPIVCNVPSSTTGSVIANQPWGLNISALEITGNGTSGNNSPAFMAFHRPGANAAYFGFDTDATFAFGANSYDLGNYATVKLGRIFCFNSVGVSPFRVTLNTPPANNATGTAGEIRIGTDGGVYICVSANSWRRVMTTTY